MHPQRFMTLFVHTNIEDRQELDEIRILKKKCTFKPFYYKLIEFTASLCIQED